MDATIDEFSQNCRQLRKVTIGSQERTLSTSSLVRLVQRCHLLDAICISDEYGVLTDEFLAELARNCPLLADLELSFAHISQVSLDALATHSGHLHRVWLSSCSITFAGSMCTSSFSALRVLGLHDVGFNDASLDVLLSRSPALDNLSLFALELVTATGIKAVVRHCPRLRELLFCDQSCLDDAVLCEVIEFSHLRSFSAVDCANVTDFGICELVKRHPQLHKLDILANPQLSDRVLYCLASHCPGLRSVNLARCDGFTEAGVVALLEGCPRLSSVSAHFCSGLKEETRRLLEEFSTLS
jgi:hypothetical protein